VPAFIEGMGHSRHYTQVNETGTISDFDEAGEFGVIDSDDGRMLLFNLKNVPASQHRRFRVGARVRFEAHENPLAPRAVGLKVVQPSSEAGSAGR
jgi:cold shock CspA family protein